METEEDRKVGKQKNFSEMPKQMENDSEENCRRSSQRIKSKTLWNAKRELEIDSVKRGKQWYWMLPE